MSGRVRGSCNKEQQIKELLAQAIGEAKNIVLTVARMGANFIVELKTTDEQVPIPVAIKQRVSDVIANLIKKLKLGLDKHTCDGFCVKYKLASS